MINISVVRLLIVLVIVAGIGVASWFIFHQAIPFWGYCALVGVGWNVGYRIP
jgi:hypothetical protein